MLPVVIIVMHNINNLCVVFKTIFAGRQEKACGWFCVSAITNTCAIIALNVNTFSVTY